MKSKRFVRCVIASLAVAAVHARGGEVIATNSLVGDWVKSIGGAKIPVRVIVGPNQDAHTYEPTPEDVRALAEASVIFASGAGFEPWLPDLIRSSKTNAVLVDLSLSVPLRQAPGSAHDVDPHYWNDVGRVLAALPSIREALSNADPARRVFFDGQEKEYSQRLKSLDTWVRSVVQAVPADRRKIVTAHDSIGYWAAAYGFRVVGNIFGSLTTEAADPSARHVRELVKAIQAEKVPAVFAENFGTSRLIHRVAEEAGVRLGPPLYTDALGPPGSPASSYEELVRHNTLAIVEALSL